MPAVEAWDHLPEATQARLWRLSAGMTQAEVARLTGHSIREVRSIEAGKANAASMQAYRMACACHLAGLRFAWGSVEMEPAPGMRVRVRARR